MSLPLPGPAAVSALPDLAGFRRPRLRDDVPILWRGESSIQLGDDVVVDRVTRSHVAWMTSLDGLASPADLEESLTIPEHEARRLVRALLAAGAIDDAARIPVALRWASPEQRDAVAGRFGAALRTCRDLDSAYATLESRDRCTVAITGPGRSREAVATPWRPVVSRSVTTSTRRSRCSPTRRIPTCPVTSTTTCRIARTCTSASWATARSSDRSWCRAPRPACGAPTCTVGMPMPHGRSSRCSGRTPCVDVVPPDRPAARAAGRSAGRAAGAPVGGLHRATPDAWSGYALELRLPDGIPQRARPSGASSVRMPLAGRMT